MKDRVYFLRAVPEVVAYKRGCPEGVPLWGSLGCVRSPSPISQPSEIRNRDIF